jgi:hypothetical protein
MSKHDIEYSRCMCCGSLFTRRSFDKRQGMARFCSKRCRSDWLHAGNDDREKKERKPHTGYPGALNVRGPEFQFDE